MKKLFFVFALILAFQNAYSQASWKIVNGSSEQVVSGKAYHLQEVKNGYHLRYKSRPYGINLGWGKQAMPNIKFEKSGGGAVNCGDRIAVFVQGGGYLMYQVRKYGINLVWSKTPVYEWELRNWENQKGTPVNSDVNVGLYNATTNDFVRHCTRVAVHPTVDLAWVKDCPGGWRTGTGNDLVKTLTKEDVQKAIEYTTALISLL